MLQLVLHQPLGKFGQNFEQVALDQVRLGHASRDIAAILVVVDKLEPFPQVLQAQQGIVSERIRSVVADAAELRKIRYAITGNEQNSRR